MFRIPKKSNNPWEGTDLQKPFEDFVFRSAGDSDFLEDYVSKTDLIATAEPSRFQVMIWQTCGYDMIIARDFIDHCAICFVLEEETLPE